MQANNSRNKAPKKAASERYISFNRREWAALQQVGFRERWAYSQLKWLANFTTGVVGDFGKQCVTYTSIAKLVDAPGVQGRGQGGIDDTQAADFLRRLQAVGLVDKIQRRSNGGLTFVLPLSPIVSPESAKIEASEATADAQAASASANEKDPKGVTAFSPTEELPPFDETPAFTRDPEPSTNDLSILTNEKEIISIEGLRSVNIEAAAPCSRAAGAAVFPEAGEASPPRPRTMTPAEIHKALAQDYNWTGADSSEAWALYETWALRGLRFDQLAEAMCEVFNHLPPDRWVATPRDLHGILDGVLRGSRSAA